MEIPAWILEEDIAQDEYGEKALHADRLLRGMLVVGPTGFVISRRVQRHGRAREHAGQRFDILIDNEAVELVADESGGTFGCRIAIHLNVLEQRVVPVTHVIEHVSENAIVIEPVEFHQMRFE